MKAQVNRIYKWKQGEYEKPNQPRHEKQITSYILLPLKISTWSIFFSFHGCISNSITLADCESITVSITVTGFCV